MKLVVLGGGNSPEREVSLRSAKAVANAARQAGFDVEERDPAEGIEFLNRLGAPLIVLPILHGKGGEDGVLQKELEKRGIAYLGSGSASSARCFNKWLTREDLLSAGVPMANAELVSRAGYHSSALSKKPHVLKVVRGGSSIGTLIARGNKPPSPDKIDAVFKLDSQAVLEELIEGDELTVPIFDKSALTAIEIVPPRGGEFDYENKYNGASAELCPPKSISPGLQSEAKRLAEIAHKIMKCRHLSRVDMMIRGTNIFVLEINTIPGLTDQSLYPKSAAAAGMSMAELVKNLVKLVIRDYNLGQAL